MKCSSCLWNFIFAFLLNGFCFAADDVLCPDTIKVEQKAVSPSPEWEVSYSSLPAQLDMITFFNGPPEENASLLYDGQLKIKGGWIGIWHFPKDDRGYWIRCSYEGTRAELSRRLPVSVNVCRVTYDEGVHFASGLPAIRKVECR